MTQKKADQFYDLLIKISDTSIKESSWFEDSKTTGEPIDLSQTQVMPMRDPGPKTN